VLGVVCLAVFIVLLVAAFSSSAPPFQASLPKGSDELLSSGRPLPQVVAFEGPLRIQLPISQREVTALGYHGTAGAALPLDPVGRQANEGLFSRMVHWLFGGGGHGVTYYELGGEVGSATAALDVGAAEGTDVYSPVDGVVVSIDDYVLDGRSHGNTIEVQPNDLPSVVVVITRLRVDPSLTVGEPVVAGTSKLGVVIDLSSVERQALAKVTHDAGNHVTIEVDPAPTLPVR
jgi:murein DD-endopeptidase MepM/ murein hydrolase activator NlpD